MTSQPATGMPLDLFLVRHGESEANVALEAAKAGDHSLLTDEFRELNVSDYRLTPMGQIGARIAGNWLCDWLMAEGLDGFDRLYCSPYVRTRETAALLDLPNARWQLESLLRERDFGLWVGLGREEIKELYPRSAELKQRNKFLWRPEGGESTSDLDLRVREVLATLAREMSGRRVLCVTHEDVMWAFRYRLEKMTIEEWLRHDAEKDSKIPNCGILHYTRLTESGEIADKFVRVRLVAMPPSLGFDWQPIERPRFTNDELKEQVKAYRRVGSYEDEFDMLDLSTEQTESPGREEPAEQGQSTDPLPALGAALGDEPLRDELRVWLRSPSSIDDSYAVIRDGDLVAYRLLRDGASSYFIDEWVVSAEHKGGVLKKLIRKQFPKGPPWDEDLPEELWDEAILRLIRARFEDAQSVGYWFDRSRIPNTNSEQYYSGLSKAITTLRSEGDGTDEEEGASDGA